MRQYIIVILTKDAGEIALHTMSADDKLYSRVRTQLHLRVANNKARSFEIIPLDEVPVWPLAGLDPLRVVLKLALINGTVSINNGVAVLDDGTAIDLNEALGRA